jgi:hypothetical protein
MNDWIKHSFFVFPIAVWLILSYDVYNFKPVWFLDVIHRIAAALIQISAVIHRLTSVNKLYSFLLISLNLRHFPTRMQLEIAGKYIRDHVLHETVTRVFCKRGTDVTHVDIVWSIELVNHNVYRWKTSGYRTFETGVPNIVIPWI